MKLPWKRSKKQPMRHDLPEEHAGEKARQEASKNLEAARARWPEVRRVSASLRELREHNGFLELIEHALQGGHR